MVPAGFVSAGGRGPAAHPICEPRQLRWVDVAACISAVDAVLFAVALGGGFALVVSISCIVRVWLLALLCLRRPLVSFLLAPRCWSTWSGTAASSWCPCYKAGSRRTASCSRSALLRAAIFVSWTMDAEGARAAVPGDDPPGSGGFTGATAAFARRGASILGSGAGDGLPRSTVSSSNPVLSATAESSHRRSHLLWTSGAVQFSRSRCWWAPQLLQLRARQ